MSAPYSLGTPAQLRAFHLLTLAQMAHLESLGITVTHTTAKRQAMAALDERDTYVIVPDLIRRLRTAAHASVGLEQAAPETAGTATVEESAQRAAATLRRLTDPVQGG
jgi:D-alanyl-D-alanine dipeptidase